MSKETFNAYLGAGTCYHGSVSFSGVMLIDGEFNGEIKSEGTLILGKNCRVQGQIHVAQLVLNGTLEGDIVVDKKTEMQETARLLGNLDTPVLLMTEGALLQGSVNMLGEKSSMEQAPESHHL